MSNKNNITFKDLVPGSIVYVGIGDHMYTRKGYEVNRFDYNNRLSMNLVPGVIKQVERGPFLSDRVRLLISVLWDEWCADRSPIMCYMTPKCNSTSFNYGNFYDANIYNVTILLNSSDVIDWINYVYNKNINIISECRLDDWEKHREMAKQVEYKRFLMSRIWMISRNKDYSYGYTRREVFSTLSLGKAIRTDFSLQKQMIKFAIKAFSNRFRRK